MGVSTRNRGYLKEKNFQSEDLMITSVVRFGAGAGGGAWVLGQRSTVFPNAVYRRDCATCVMARGVGDNIVECIILRPRAYVLTADVAGPLQPGFDATSKGTIGKNLKYLLAVKYMIPRDFVVRGQSTAYGQWSSL